MKWDVGLMKLDDRNTTILLSLFILLAISQSLCKGKTLHHRNTHKTLGIVGGNEIPIEQAPYMASIRKINKGHECGGSIIHEKFILSAAHCMNRSAQYYKVLLGTNENDDRTGEVYEVEKVILHENFISTSPNNDISLVKLRRNIKFGPKISMIKLSSTRLDPSAKPTFLVSGWGRTKRHTGLHSDVLIQVALPLYPWKMCKKVYSVLNDDMICAGTEGKGICEGDSGGPLTLNNTQFGIVSFGRDCGVYPGVFTEVSAYLDWIRAHIELNLP